MKKALRSQFGQLTLRVADPKFKHKLLREGDYIIRVWDKEEGSQALISYFPSVKRFMVGKLSQSKASGPKMAWSRWVKDSEEVMDLIEEALQ